MKCGFVIFCANAYEDWQQEVAETAEMLVTGVSTCRFRSFIVFAQAQCERKRAVAASLPRPV